MERNSRLVKGDGEARESLGNRDAEDALGEKIGFRSNISKKGGFRLGMCPVTSHVTQNVVYENNVDKALTLVDPVGGTLGVDPIHSGIWAQM